MPQQTTEHKKSSRCCLLWLRQTAYLASEVLQEISVRMRLQPTLTTPTDVDENGSMETKIEYRPAQLRNAESMIHGHHMNGEQDVA